MIVLRFKVLCAVSDSFLLFHRWMYFIGLNPKFMTNNLRVECFFSPSLVAHLLFILIINDIFIELIEMRNKFRHFRHSHTHTGSPTHDIPIVTRQVIITRPNRYVGFVTSQKEIFTSKNMKRNEHELEWQQTIINAMVVKRLWNHNPARFSIDFIHILCLLNVQNCPQEDLSGISLHFSHLHSCDITLTYVIHSQKPILVLIFFFTFIHSFLIPVQISDDTFMPFVRLLNWKWREKNETKHEKNCVTNYAFA